MIQNDQELKGAMKRISKLLDSLTQLRNNCRPEECSSIAVGHRIEVERIQREVLDYLTQPEAKFAGPAELVDAVLRTRAGLGKAFQQYCGNISNEGLWKLVHLSYYSSLLQEEGRDPRFRIWVAGRHLPVNWDDRWKLGNFSTPVLLKSAQDLRKLAPCISSHDYALEVREASESDKQCQLMCYGIRLAHSGERGVNVFDTALFSRHTVRGLMIRVDSPAVLRVSEGSSTWELRAGKLVDLGGYPLHPLPTWLDKAATVFSKDDKELFVGINVLLGHAWHEILHLASEQRRGGCFVVLPTSNCSLTQLETDFNIRLKYPMSGIVLTQSVVDYLQHCCSDKNDTNLSERAVNDWLSAKSRLLARLELIANLSGVDGCTVFDADLNLLGFGGSIEAPQNYRGKQYLDARAGSKEIDQREIMKTGKRHSSAYNLCQAHDNVWCYVVSQDGDATAIWSDQRNTVRRWHPYATWAKASDHK